MRKCNSSLFGYKIRNVVGSLRLVLVRVSRACCWFMAWAFAQREIGRILALLVDVPIV